MTARGRCALSILFALLLGSFPALAQTPPPPAERQVLVKEIAVQGNRRVQEAVILARVGAKIGSPFVANRTAEDIRSIFSLARELGLTIIVEGVESTVQLLLLAEWGCDLYQGFLGAGALDEAELARFVAVSRSHAA